MCSFLVQRNRSPLLWCGFSWLLRCSGTRKSRNQAQYPLKSSRGGRVDTPSLLEDEKECVPEGLEDSRSNPKQSSACQRKTQSDDSAESEGHGCSRGKCPGWEEPQRSQNSACSLAVLVLLSPRHVSRHSHSSARLLRGCRLTAGALPWGSPNCWSHRRSLRGARSEVHPGHLQGRTGRVRRLSDNLRPLCDSELKLPPFMGV